MNKYQKALDYVNKSVCTALSCLGVNDTKTKESLHTLQELVDKEKSPTIEEVKKEWEELGYKLLYCKQDSTLIELLNENKMTIIIINNNEKSYIKLLAYDYSSYCPLNFQEHQLLTKTFKALGWL